MSHYKSIRRKRVPPPPAQTRPVHERDKVKAGDLGHVIIRSNYPAVTMPSPPAVQSSNIVTDWRAGGIHDIQDAGVVTLANALSATAPGGVHSSSTGGHDVYPVDFVTNFDGAGTHAFQLNWTKCGGLDPCEGCDNNNGEHDNEVYMLHYVDDSPAPDYYVQWKTWWGRTASGGGMGDSQVGEFNHTGHKLQYLWRRSGGGDTIDGRFYTAYQGSSMGFSQEWYGSASAWYNEVSLGQTPHNLNNYNNQVVTLTWYVRPGVTDGIARFWINAELVFNRVNVNTAPSAWGQVEVGGPTWICPPQDQTQYIWDLVAWKE